MVEKNLTKNSLNEIYKKISSVVPEIEWKFHAPLIQKINKLKKDKNAVILAHNYQTPEIYYGVADISADSLALALEAAKTSANIIVLCGVHFMAETAKLMNPQKKILLPDMNAGCSLASSITAEDVRMLKEKYPGVPVVSYVNTSAEVKAESDICCTSANAVKIVESLGVDKVIFIPDYYLANYVQKKTKVKIISWQGTCIVHEKFSAKEVEDIRKENQPKKVLLVTECSMSDNVQVENPNVQFIRPCNLCPHMKRISLNKIFDCLKNESNEIKISHNISEMARKSVQRMAEIGR